MVDVLMLCREHGPATGRARRPAARWRPARTTDAPSRCSPAATEPGRTAAQRSKGSTRGSLRTTGPSPTSPTTTN